MTMSLTHGYDKKMRKEERKKVRKRKEGKKVRTTRQEMECFANLRQC